MATVSPFLRLSNNVVERPLYGKGLLSPLWRDPATGGFKAVAYEDHVKACIEDVIQTLVGERVMNEDFGTLVNRAVFESMQVAIDILPVNIREAIARHEPRVTRVAASGRPMDETSAIIDVSWILKATGQPGSLVYPHYLEGNNG